MKKVIPYLLAGSSLLAGCKQVGVSTRVDTIEQKNKAKEIYVEFQKSGYNKDVLAKHSQELLSYGYVCDAANMLNDKQEASIEAMLDSMKVEKGVMGALVTFPGIDIPNSFGTHAIRGLGWGIEGVNNGFMMTRDSKKNELHGRTGYGMEGSLPDGLIHNMIRKTLDETANKISDQNIKNILKQISKTS